MIAKVDRECIPECQEVKQNEKLKICNENCRTVW